MNTKGVDGESAVAQAAESTLVNIELVYALPEKQQLVSMAVPAGTEAREATNLALQNQLIVLADDEPAFDSGTGPIGVYGLLVADDHILQEGDRLELYRPLQQDPKERRRQMADQKSSMRASPSRSQK